MSFRRYEIILPTRFNDGTPIAEENHLWVAEQLATQFGAYTMEPHPIRGVWTHEGMRYEENNLRVWVIFQLPFFSGCEKSAYVQFPVDSPAVLFVRPLRRVC